MKKILCMVFVMVASGCATYPNTYNPGGVQKEELAKVTFEKRNARHGWFAGEVLAVFDENAKRVIQVQDGFGYGTKAHREVFLPEGKFLIVAYCSNGSIYSNPRIPLALKNKRTYTLACVNHTEKGFLGLDLNKSVSLELLPEGIR